MHLNGITPEEAAIRWEKRIEEEEIARRSKRKDSTSDGMDGLRDYATPFVHDGHPMVIDHGTGGCHCGEWSFYYTDLTLFIESN